MTRVTMTSRSGAGPLDPAPFPVRPAQPISSLNSCEHRVLRVELDGQAVFTNRLPALALVSKGVAEAVMCEGEFRAKGDAETDVRKRVFRVELDAPTVFTDRLFALALVVKNVAKVMMREGQFRVELDGQPIFVDRLFEPVLI